METVSGSRQCDKWRQIRTRISASLKTDDVLYYISRGKMSTKMYMVELCLPWFLHFIKLFDLAIKLCLPLRMARNLHGHSKGIHQLADQARVRPARLSQPKRSCKLCML